jgi:hypothetical protein
MVGFFPFHVGLDYNRSKIYIVLFVMSEKSVERFQKKVETIKSELDEIKKSTEASDLEKKKQDIDKKIYAATEAIDDELSELKKDSDTNKEAISKLEELKKTLDSFAPELSNLKKEVLDTNTKDTKEATKEEGKPSLFAKIFYWWIIGKLAGNIPIVGDSIKDWADGKLKESGEEAQKEKEKTKDDKPWFWSKAFKRIGGAALVGGAIALGSKASSSEGGFWNTLKGRFSSDKTEQPQTPTDPVAPESATPNPETNPSQTPETPLDTPSTTDVVDWPLNEEDSKATETVKQLYNSGHSSLYILFRMYQLGFVPKYDWVWKGSSVWWKIWYIANWWPFVKILDKMGSMRKNLTYWMNDAITQNKEFVIKSKLEVIKTNPWLQSVYDQRIHKLSQMQKDIASNSFNLDSFEKAYSTEIKEFSTRDPQKLKTQLQEKFTNLTEIQKDIKVIDQDISKMKQDAKLKLDELDKKAKLDPKNVNKYKLEAKNLISDYNQKILLAEKQMGIRTSGLKTTDQIDFLSKKNASFGKLVKINWWVAKYFESTKIGKKVNGAGKFMVGAAVLSLLAKGVSDNTADSWKTVGLQASDLAMGMVPFAWGIYDLTTSITWEWFAGSLSTTDRWIRWVAWGTSVILDTVWAITAWTWVGGVAWFGWSAAIKAWSRSIVIWTKVVKWLKTVEKVAETVQLWYKLATFWYLGYVFSEEMKPIAVGLFDAIDHKTESDVTLSV